MAVQARDFNRLLFVLDFSSVSHELPLGMTIDACEACGAVPRRNTGLALDPCAAWVRLLALIAAARKEKCKKKNRAG